MTEDEQDSLLSTLTEREKAELAYRWEGWIARPTQHEPLGDWRYWLVMAGRGFGKTRIGAEAVRRWVKDFEFVNLIGATADDARDIMIEGESGILAICPPWERPEYRPSKRRLDWPNGAKSLIFTADEPERLRGKQHMRLWGDELAAWKYPDAWDQAMLGLRLGKDPRAVVTTTPKPTRLVRDLREDEHCVTTRGRTYDNLPNLAPAFAAEIIKRYEGTRLGRQELEGELLEDEGMAYRFDERIHCVPAFEIPSYWTRSEGMDFGSSAPTAWLAAATDTEGTDLIYDMLYEPGIPSETAPRILERRAAGYRPQPWLGYDDKGAVLQFPIVWGDPASMANRPAIAGHMGVRTSIGQEFVDNGVPITPANNDRCAGYIRIAELLRCDPERRFPSWHPFAGELGAPRLFLVGDRVPELVAQLKDAPVEDEGKLHAGEAVHGAWESSHGHAHAALRYWALSRPAPSKAPVVEPDDPRAAHWQKLERQLDELPDEEDDPFVRRF